MLREAFIALICDPASLFALMQCSVSSPGYLNFPAAPSAAASTVPSTQRPSRKRSSRSEEVKEKEATDAVMKDSVPVAQPAASSSPSPAPKAHQVSVTQVPAVFTDEAYQVYRKYQHQVHGDALSEISPKQYTRFLCHSSLRVRPRFPRLRCTTQPPPPGLR